jgi:hypothetical protein
VLEEARGHLTGYDAVTREEVNRAAHTLDGETVVAVVVLPAPDTEPVAAVPKS